ncbi:MAG: PIN domain-containing protein [Gemmatimonadetes bacterium]|nr:PIN domain-containing protein [Gemmatimonadota bacterium]
MPLLLRQPCTAAAVAAHAADREMVVWWGTPVECASAIARLHREKHLSVRAERDARTRLATIARSWYELQPGDAVRNQAMRLLRVHALRAADALQLAAALEWSGTPAQGAFVTFDARLKAAAEREGFAVEP